MPLVQCLKLRTVAGRDLFTGNSAGAPILDEILHVFPYFRVSQFLLTNLQII
jgi:hypothetical protein